MDHRPDLKQAVLSLVVNCPACIPLWMVPQDGNTSDKKSFHETIKWVADSALYSTKILLANNEYLWLTRVQETILAVRELVSKKDEDNRWVEGAEGYKYAPHPSEHGGIAKRSQLVFFQHAYARERKTLEKNMKAKEEAVIKEIWLLGKKEYGCTKEAEEEIQKLRKQNPLSYAYGEVVPILKFAGRGKPKVDEEREIKGYRVD